MVVRARVRGIYSTALSKILHDNGVELVDVTEPIARRLDIDTKRGLPADVTVKTDESNASQILILGFPKEVVEVSDILENTVPQVITYKPKIGLYAAFKTVVKERRGRDCIVETPVGEAILVDHDSCNVGEEVEVTVVKIPVKPGEKMVVSSKVRVIGKYAIVGRGSGVSFSSFIRNKSRITQLLNVSTKYIRNGFSIRWRSNADEAPLTDIVSELPELISKLGKLEESLHGSGPLEVVYQGEYMRLLELTYNSKLYLDGVRRSVTPTAPYHHMLRSGEGSLSAVVDLLDIIAEKVQPALLIEWIRKWIVKRLSDRKDIILYHRRLSNNDIVLGKATAIECDVSKGLKVKLLRNVKSKGVYDGLGALKEPGDVIETEISEGKWYIVHRYFTRDNVLKGLYVNINTPPEMHPSGCIKYIDLGVDIVKDSNGCKIIDTEEFREYVKEELLNYECLAEALKAITEAVDRFCVR